MYTELSAFSDNNRRMAVELGLTDWPVFIIACQNDVSPDTKTMFIKTRFRSTPGGWKQLQLPREECATISGIGFRSAQKSLSLKLVFRS